VFFLFNSSLDLRAHSADCHETLTHDRYLGVLYNPSPKIWGLSPKKFWGQKHAQFGAILHKLRLWSQISPERDKISKIGKTCDWERFLPRSAKQVRWTLVRYPESRICEFGPIQIDFFRETIFQPLWGAGPWNFYTCCSLTKPCKHTPQTGSGVPKNFKGEQLKLGLKISKRVPITLG